MNPIQQDLPLPLWGGARRGAGRKRKSLRKNVPHVARRRFHRGALHVTVRMRREVWNLRTHRCFRAIKRALERGCERFGFRLVHFYVLENWAVHAEREDQQRPVGVDPFSSASRHEGPPLAAEAEWWMLCVGIARARTSAA